MSRVALLAGATGAIGGHLLGALLESPAYREVRVLTRRPLGREHPKLTSLTVDFTQLAQKTEALRADDVFNCLGTTLKKAGSRDAFRTVDHHYVVALAQAAYAAGAQQFIGVSSVGASATSGSFYLRVKGEMERDVIAVGFSACHFMHPSLLLGDRAEFRPGEKFAQVLAPVWSPLMAGPLKKYRPVQTSEVAAAMLQVAQRGQTGVHRHFLPLAD